MVEEFVADVDSGFGFIFEDDIQKYWANSFGDYASDEDLEAVKIRLREKDMLK